MTAEPTRIAIIGCGYVGLAVGQALAANHCDVIGTTTSPERIPILQETGLRAEVLTLSEAERLCGILADREVVYLTIAPRSHGQDYREVYLESAMSLVRALNGTAVKRIIYTSSTRVYGQDDGSWVDEDSPTSPTDENGCILLEAEKVLLDTATELKPGRSICTTIARLAGIYGPGRDPTQRIISLAGQELEDDNRFVNMIHRNDIVSALCKLRSIRHHGVLNLSDDLPMTRRAYYDAILTQAGKPSIKWLHRSDTPHGKRIRNQQIKKLLNFELEHISRLENK